MKLALVIIDEEKKFIAARMSESVLLETLKEYMDQGNDLDEAFQRTVKDIKFQVTRM